MVMARGSDRSARNWTERCSSRSSAPETINPTRRSPTIRGTSATERVRPAARTVTNRRCTSCGTGSRTTGLRARPHLLLEVLARSAQRGGHAVEGRGELSKLVGGACIDIDGEISGTDGARRRGQRLYGTGDPPREKESGECREDEHDPAHGDGFADEPLDRRQYRVFRGEVEQRPGDRRQPSNDAEVHQPVLGSGSLEFVRYGTVQYVRELLRHRHRCLEQLPGLVAEAALGREHRDGGGVQWRRGMEHLLSPGAVRDAHAELIVHHRIAARTRAPVSLRDELPEFPAARRDQ